ncbi:hypothetical protein FOL47_007210 [Perkinsus chesapeaki]|uniref:Mei2-like C-terminal RNA recognition motif domain-containing protein n=1 Tax=Perkinsus chesapeaki TaxID=330153 RepID=A0A7J6LM07_PERCH|nr:hypothetical protein FOL47_007210 [Perkinsus chesapeaki]
MNSVDIPPNQAVAGKSYVAPNNGELLRDGFREKITSPTSWRSGAGTLEFKNTFISLRLNDPVKGVVDLDSDEDAGHESQGPTDGEDIDEQVCSGYVRKHWKCRAFHRREQSCPPAVKGGVCELVDHSPSTICTHGNNVCPRITTAGYQYDDDKELSQQDNTVGAFFDNDEQVLLYNPRPLWERRGTHRGSARSRFAGDNHARNNTAIPSHDRRNSRQGSHGAGQSPMGEKDRNSNNHKYFKRSAPILRESSVDTRSTVMLRNIPYSMGQTKVLEILFSHGFRSKIDFFYAPLDFSSGNNLGYAFVNLKRPEFVNEFFFQFNNVPLSNFGATWNVKKLQVCWARVQGFEANVDHYNNSPVIEMPEAFRPIIVYEDDHKEAFYHYLTNVQPINYRRERMSYSKLQENNHGQNDGSGEGFGYQQDITPETRPVTPSWDGQEAVLVGPHSSDPYRTVSSNTEKSTGSPVKRDSRKQQQYRR